MADNLQASRVDPGPALSQAASSEGVNAQGAALTQSVMASQRQAAAQAGSGIARGINRLADEYKASNDPSAVLAKAYQFRRQAAEMDDLDQRGAAEKLAATGADTLGRDIVRKSGLDEVGYVRGVVEEMTGGKITWDRMTSAQRDYVMQHAKSPQQQQYRVRPSDPGLEKSAGKYNDPRAVGMTEDQALGQMDSHARQAIEQALNGPMFMGDIAARHATEREANEARLRGEHAYANVLKSTDDPQLRQIARELSGFMKSPTPLLANGKPMTLRSMMLADDDWTPEDVRSLRRASDAPAASWMFNAQGKFAPNEIPKGLPKDVTAVIGASLSHGWLAQMASVSSFNAAKGVRRQMASLDWSTADVRTQTNLASLRAWQKKGLISEQALDGVMARALDPNFVADIASLMTKEDDPQIVAQASRLIGELTSDETFGKGMRSKVGVDNWLDKLKQDEWDAISSTERVPLPGSPLNSLSGIATDADIARTMNLMRQGELGSPLQRKFEEGLISSGVPRERTQELSSRYGYAVDQVVTEARASFPGFADLSDRDKAAVDRAAVDGLLDQVRTLYAPAPKASPLREASLEQQSADAQAKLRETSKNPRDLDDVSVFTHGGRRWAVERGKVVGLYEEDGSFTRVKAKSGIARDAAATAIHVAEDERVGSADDIRQQAAIFGRGTGLPYLDEMLRGDVGGRSMYDAMRTDLDEAAGKRDLFAYSALADSFVRKVMSKTGKSAAEVQDDLAEAANKTDDRVLSQVAVYLEQKSTPIKTSASELQTADGDIGRVMAYLKDAHARQMEMDRVDAIMNRSRSSQGQPQGQPQGQGAPPQQGGESSTPRGQTFEFSNGPSNFGGPQQGAEVDAASFLAASDQKAMTSLQSATERNMRMVDMTGAQYGVSPFEDVFRAGADAVAGGLGIAEDAGNLWSGFAGPRLERGIDKLNAMIDKVVGK